MAWFIQNWTSRVACRVPRERWLRVGPQVKLPSRSVIHGEAHQRLGRPPAIHRDVRPPFCASTGRETERIRHRLGVEHPRAMMATKDCEEAKVRRTTSRFETITFGEIWISYCTDWRISTSFSETRSPFRRSRAASVSHRSDRSRRGPTDSGSPGSPRPCGSRPRTRRPSSPSGPRCPCSCRVGRRRPAPWSCPPSRRIRSRKRKGFG